VDGRRLNPGLPALAGRVLGHPRADRLLALPQRCRYDRSGRKRPGRSCFALRRDPRPYRAGAYLEVAAYSSGTFRAAVEWFDAGGASLQVDPIPTAGLSAVTPRTRFERTLTAPTNAATAAVKFEWTGGGAGTAFADTFSFAPDNAQATVKDNPGAGSAPEWGAQRIIDFSQAPPKEVGTYRSPTSTVWPPPDDGIYAPRQARMFGTNVAFTTWLSDGVRALDVSNPASPKEVGSFVPPAVNDPSPAAGAGVSNLDIGDPNNLLRGQSWPNRPLATGVGVIPRSPTTATVVVRDINGGLYVLNAEVDPVTGSPPPGGGGPGPGPGPGPIPGLLPRANLPGPRLGVRRLVRGRRTIFLVRGTLRLPSSILGSQRALVATGQSRSPPGAGTGPARPGRCRCAGTARSRRPSWHRHASSVPRGATTSGCASTATPTSTPARKPPSSASRSLAQHARNPEATGAARKHDRPDHAFAFSALAPPRVGLRAAAHRPRRARPPSPRPRPP